MAGGARFLIKELVTVTLVVTDAMNNNWDPVPLKCIINRLHSLLSTPPPQALLFISLWAVCIPSGRGICHFLFSSKGTSDFGGGERMTSPF